MDENKKETIMAFVRLACMFLSSTMAMIGITVDADSMFVGATIVLSGVAFIWAWWKNNNVTSAAQEAQKVLDELKNGETNE
jgi:SPP1 family holin